MPLLSQAARYFEKVAELQSVRQAATILCINPSAISRQILALEEELGLPLFERRPRGLKLTAAGQMLLAQVHRWGEDRLHLVDALKSLGGYQPCASTNASNCHIDVTDICETLLLG
jgi:DNA-binding transcriptional LysR family regulator